MHNSMTMVDTEGRTKWITLTDNDGGGGACERLVANGRHPSKRNPPECIQERLVCKPIYVLRMIVRLIGPLRLFLGLARVNTLEDAQAPVSDEGHKIVVKRILPMMHSPTPQPCSDLLCRASGTAHLNSDNRSCSFRTACVRVIYCAAFPAFP